MSDYLQALLGREATSTIRPRPAVRFEPAWEGEAGEDIAAPTPPRAPVPMPAPSALATTTPAARSSETVITRVVSERDAPTPAPEVRPVPALPTTPAPPPPVPPAAEPAARPDVVRAERVIESRELVHTETVARAQSPAPRPAPAPRAPEPIATRPVAPAPPAVPAASAGPEGVRISIGRIEVRAVAEPVRERPVMAPAAPELALDDYLRDRSRRT